MTPQFSFNNVYIASIAATVPSFIQKIPLEDGKVSAFQKQTGIAQRRISLLEQSGTDLAYGAAVNALERANWDKNEIGAVIFLSQMPDFNIATCNAFIMHARLGLPSNVLAFDLTLGCSSFLYGLAMCASLLQNNAIKKCLLLSSDPQWHFYPNKEVLLADRKFIHGEAAAAICVELRDNNEVFLDLYSQGSGFHYILNPFSNVKNAWRQDKKVKLPDGVELQNVSKANYMDGLEITAFSTTTVVDSIKLFMEKRNKAPEDYDGLVLHQANMQIIKTIARRLKFPMEKVPLTIEQYANTSGTSLPLTLVDGYVNSQKEKLTLLTSVFGTGLSWGVAEITLNPSAIVPIEIYDGRDESLLGQ